MYSGALALFPLLNARPRGENHFHSAPHALPILSIFYTFWGGDSLVVCVPLLIPIAECKILYGQRIGFAVCVCVRRGLSF